MDIEDVKKERSKLTADISELINTFQRRTGATVRSVDLTRLLTIDSDAVVKTQVAIKLEI